MRLLTFNKKLSLFGAICVTVGAVIGVGIFVIVRPIGLNSGPWMPLAFAIAALPAILGTVVAVALGGTIPADGGGYYYTKCLIGQRSGAAVSAMVVVGAMGALGTVSVGVAKYLQMYLPGIPPPAVAIALILFSWGINYLGVMASEKLQIAMVLQLVSALLLVIIAALIGGAAPDFSQPLPEGLGGFAGAAVLACLAYTGFNIVGELGDEIENPHRNIPITVAVGLGVIAVIYVGVGWIVAGALPRDELANARAPLLTAALLYLPDWLKHYINLAALAGAVTSINAAFLAIPRELAALAQDRILPAWAMRFDEKRQTFTIGIALVAIAGCGMMLLDQDEETWGVVTVAGLLLANVFFSLAVFTLFKRFPEKVAAAPLTVRRAWLYPAGALSAVFSLAFGLLALAQWWPNAIIIGVAVSAALLLTWRAPRGGQAD